MHFFLAQCFLLKPFIVIIQAGLAFSRKPILISSCKCAGIFLYMLFMQKFLATKQNHPFLYKLYNIGCTDCLLFQWPFITYAHYFTDNFALENRIENGTKILLLLMVVIFLVYSTRVWNERLLRYLFWGNFFLLLFSVLIFADAY